MQRYGKVTLTSDIFFVRQILFLTTHTRSIEYGTLQHFPITKKPVLLHLLAQVEAVYERGSFKMINIMMDGKYNPLRALLFSVGIILNILAAYEYVGEVE